VVAVVTGSTGEPYRVTRSAGGRWGCTCLAAAWNVSDCSHRTAVRMVTEE